MNSRLKIIRKKMGLTQEQFSEKLGISNQAYMKYESGKRNIPAPVLVTLQEFGYSTDWLLTGSGAMHIIKSGPAQYAIVNIPPGLTREDVELYMRTRAETESLLKEKDIIDQKIYKIEQALSELDEEDRDRMLNGFLSILGAI